MIPRQPPVLQRRPPGGLFKLPAEGRGIRKTAGICNFRYIPACFLQHIHGSLQPQIQ